MESPGILRFEPLFRTVRWGGTRLSSFKRGVVLPSSTVGESWEISNLEGYETVVAEGPFIGRLMSDMISQFGREILGERLHGVFGNFFPLLVKFIDAEDDLSIQVHPDNNMAEQGRGKTELWYIIEAEKGSYIYSGFNRSLDENMLVSAIDNNRIVDLLAKHFCSPGDVFYIPPGRVHSIGAGNLILEIQQTSGTTYRLHDYGRKDIDGQPRELHVDKALQVVDYEETDFGLVHPQLLIDCETKVKKTPFFTVTAAQVMSELSLNIKKTDSFRIIVALSGSGEVISNTGERYRIERGQTLLVPAGMDSVLVKAISTPMKIITVYIE